MDEFRRVKVKVVEDEMVGWGGGKTCFRVSGMERSEEEREVFWE